MGIKERKEREKQHRVNTIIEGAYRTFEKKGFIKTTLQDVAQEAEVSIGLIYRYFQSKEDIFASIALKGAIAFDKKIELVLKKEIQNKRKRPPEEVLLEIAQAFFEYYEPYGEYFDYLMYSYKGLKEIYIHSTTLTKLLRTTLMTLDRLKHYFQKSHNFKIEEEEEALSIVFLLWGTLLGCHKLFDKNGRGHLFAFSQDDFIKKMIQHMLLGILRNRKS